MNPSNRFLLAGTVVILSGFFIWQGTANSKEQAVLRRQLRTLETQLETLSETQQHHGHALTQQLVTTEQTNSQLDQRINQVAEKSKRNARRTSRVSSAVEDVSGQVTDIHQRVGDIEVAVGMPNSEMVLEVDVGLVSTDNVLNGCKQRFPSVPWSGLTSWAKSRIQSGWTCDRIAREAVKDNKVGNQSAIQTCAALYPNLPWEKNQRRVLRWSQKIKGCSALAKKLSERG